VEDLPWSKSSQKINGRDGSDGHPRADGAAGTIISVDSQAQPYLNKLQLINKTGGGAAEPKPEIRVADPTARPDEGL